MCTFSEFAKRYFAEKLGISVEQVEEQYNFVQSHFFVDILSSKFVHPDQPETFSARLVYNDDEGYVEAYLFGFKTENGQEDFATPEEALEVALSQIDSVKLLRVRGENFVVRDVPENVLILFDTEAERRKYAQSELFKRSKH